MLNEWLGWNKQKPSPSARVQCKAMPHFRTVTHNVSEDDLAIGGEYLKLGAGPLEERIGLDPGKIFDKAIIFFNMRMQEKSKPSLSCVLQHMIMSGKYYPTAHWVTPTSGTGWDFDRANTAWKMPHETSIE
ncbi:hypothetical protein MMC29_004709 [Sticta canariensis]|nr:hypothetical protein [Sticta canariensis]